MSYDNGSFGGGRGGMGPRRMYKPQDGETWTCAKCGGPIDQLPFEPVRNPDGTLQRPVFHRDCLPPRNN